MPVNAFPNINGAYKEVSDMSVNIGGLWKKAVGAWTNINGTWRPSWSKKVSYYGVATPLSLPRGAVTSGSIGNYAIFAGGSGYAELAQSRVDAYNVSLARTNPTALSAKRTTSEDAPHVGGYILIGPTNGSTAVDAYNSSLVKTVAPPVFYARYNYGASNNANYAMFGGGMGGTENWVDAYNPSLVVSYPTTLSLSSRRNVGSAGVGSYVLFAGGYGSSVYQSEVDAYNLTLVKSTPTALSAKKSNCTGVSFGGYALFLGGRISTPSGTANVDAYNSSLVRTTPTSLSEARYGLARASTSDVLIVHGGSGTSDSTFTNAFNTSLVRIDSPPATIQRTNTGCGASVGDYCLFGAGGSYPYYDVVDVFQYK